MKIFTEIRNALRSRRDSGETGQQIADSAEMSQVHVCNLINGKRDVGKLTLDSFLKLFPRAKIELSSSEELSLSDEEEEMLELFRQLPQKEKIKEIVAIAKLVATTKSAGVAASSAQKIS